MPQYRMPTPQELSILAEIQRRKQLAAEAAARQQQQQNAQQGAAISGATAPLANAAGIGLGAYGVSQLGGAPAMATAATAPTEITVGLGGNALGSGVTPASYEAWNAAANAATADAAAAGAPAEAGALSGLALPALGAAGAAYAGWRGYETYKKLKDGDGSFSTGFKESLKPANLPLSIGTLGLFSVGSGLASKLFGGGNVDAKKRGKLRRALEGSGFASAGDALPAGAVSDPSGTFVRLADGSYYDIGEKNKGAYNVALDTPTAVGANGALNPLAYILAGGNKKLSQDLAGYLSNAALSGGDPKKNIQAFYQAAGLDPARAHSALDQMVASGAIPQADLAAYKNGVNQAFDARRLDQDLPSIPGVTSPGEVPAELADVVHPKMAPQRPQLPAPIPQKQSNGQYRLSPGVYSKNPPSAPTSSPVVWQNLGSSGSMGLSPEQMAALQRMKEQGALR